MSIVNQIFYVNSHVLGYKPPLAACAPIGVHSYVHTEFGPQFARGTVAPGLPDTVTVSAGWVRGLIEPAAWSLLKHAAACEAYDPSPTVLGPGYDWVPFEYGGETLEVAITRDVRAPVVGYAYLCGSSFGLIVTSGNRVRLPGGASASKVEIPCPTCRRPNWRGDKCWWCGGQC